MVRSLRQARIGYGAYSPDFGVPGDRRRFCAWASHRGVSYELAELSKPYDVVYLTYRSDLPGWLSRKRQEGDRLKVVFELIDSFLSVHHSPLTGIARRVQGRDSQLSWDYDKLLRETIAAADAVVCSTAEQQAEMQNFNANVHPSLDIFDGDIQIRKSDHGRDGKLKLAWEGMCFTLSNVNAIREPLNDLRDQLELHVVTDFHDGRLWLRHGTSDARKLIKGIECEKHFHPWQRNSFAGNIVACDLAVIPIDTSDALMNGKPENKLVLLWQMGMPVLVSDTPAYVRAMQAAGTDMVCHSTADWGAKLEEFIADDGSKLAAAAAAGKAMAETVYSASALRERFDRIFESIGFQV